MNAPGRPKITTFLPRVRSSTLNVVRADRAARRLDFDEFGQRARGQLVAYFDRHAHLLWGRSGRDAFARTRAIARIAGLAPKFNPTRATGLARSALAGIARSAVALRLDEEEAMATTKKTAAAAAPRATTLLIATRKGLWTLAGDAARRTWKLAGPHFLGHIVHHAIADPRDGRTMLAAARTGHLGPTVFRSTDRGRTWKEAAQPPAFKPGSGRTVDHTFWLTPGHATEPGVWYAGTSPQGLFRSADGGATWAGVDGFNEHPQRKAWCGGDQDGTPDGPKLHSILVDPRDPRHLYIGMSSGGVFESTDGGADWRPLNHGVRR